MFIKRSQIFAGIVSAILWSYLLCFSHASATESASAHLTYLPSGVGYMDGGQEAAQAWASMRWCRAADSWINRRAIPEECKCMK